MLLLKQLNNLIQMYVKSKIFGTAVGFMINKPQGDQPVLHKQSIRVHIPSDTKRIYVVKFTKKKAFTIKSQ